MFKAVSKVVVLSLLFIVLSGVAQAATSSASWNAVTTTVGGTPVVTPVTYNLYRSANADMSSKVKLNSTPITALTFSDTTAPTGTNAYYQVHAVSGDGVEGAGSVIVLFNTNNRTPAVPRAFTVK